MMLKRVLIGVAVLAVMGGAALFILDRTVFAPVKVSSNLPSAPTLAAPVSAPTSVSRSASTAVSAASGAQLFRIDAAQSEVRYEVHETFFQGNRLNTAIGRTQGVAGDVLVNLTEPAKSQIGPIVIDISQFRSDEDRRDNFIRRNFLESGRYPTATFVTKSIDGLPASVKDGDSVAVTINGDLTVKQTTKPVVWTATLKVASGQLIGSATTGIKMSDFGVGPIQIAMLVTEDAVKLMFDFVALPVSN
jgi:polyisoprenoid-binding protein YceI